MQVGTVAGDTIGYDAIQIGEAAAAGTPNVKRMQGVAGMRTYGGGI